VTDTSPPRLPEYGNPPVDEVVCGVLFEPLKGFLLPHYGLLWEKFRLDYPHCQEVAPLMPLVETFGEPPAPEVELAEIPLPRVWFLHDDGRIIQLQRDRFLHNWRKLKPIDEYPRYRTVFHLFQSHFSTFQAFLHEMRLGPVIPRQYEMTYVNLIYQGEGWETIGDIQQVFPDFCWQERKDRFLPRPGGINWRTSFPLPDRAGRLHMQIQLAQRRADNRLTLRFEITARGFGADTAPEAMKTWFDLAHEWIIRGFADYTGPQIQREVWRRKE
jgi:uncharacterized protein (TIGR04255 family)